jgi:hypothetical protein
MSMKKHGQSPRAAAVAFALVGVLILAVPAFAAYGDAATGAASHLALAPLFIGLAGLACVLVCARIRRVRILNRDRASVWLDPESIDVVHLDEDGTDRDGRADGESKRLHSAA